MAPTIRLAEKTARIRAVLDGIHPSPTIPLDHRDPFTLLVAVVLSAQTTDKKVNEVTPRLFARAATPAAMRQLAVPEIREIIREIGLAPAKARALQGLAAQLCELHGGAVPQDFDALLALPGVGRKTANVVMSQAFGVPAFPVDTHILRLAGRWGLSRAGDADGVERDLTRVFPRDAWNLLHLQIIYFGRSHCPALRHDLASCPICAWAASPTRIAAEARANARLGRRKPRP
jgi:endonuclease-3